MKHFLPAVIALLLTCAGASAKIVKFSVDMTNNTISSKGMHVEGDFQALAGYAGGDFSSSTTSLTKEGSTNIYSVTVSIPAFRAYQFKYVNGDQFYDVEFVPAESRVRALTNDNRWIYVDSLNADTMKLAALQYGMNAPAGLYLLRFKVDLRNTLPAAATGAHVAGAFQGANPAATRLYSWGDSLYEYIAYVAAGTYDYKYYSGNTASSAETVPAACAVNGSRSKMVSTDLELDPVCFSSCTACSSIATGVPATHTAPVIAAIVPNPVQDYMLITFGDARTSHNVLLTDATGHAVRDLKAVSTAQLRMDRDELAAGIYFLRLTGDDGAVLNTKIIIQ